MGCKSCKNKKDGLAEEALLSVFKKNGKKRETEPTKSDFGFQLFNVVMRVILFAIGLLTTPLIMLFVVYLLFKTIMLNRGDVDLMPTLLDFAKSIGIGKKKVEEEHPDDYEDLDSDNPDAYDIAERVDKVKL